MPTLAELKRQKQDLVAKANKIKEGADAADRDLTDDETEKINDLLDKADEKDSEIEEARKGAEIDDRLQQANEELDEPDDRRTSPDDTARTTNVRERREDDPMAGFDSPRDYLKSVITAGKGGPIDDRLQSLRPDHKIEDTAGSDEQSTFSDPYGGFLVPEEMSPNLLRLEPEGDFLAERVQNVPMGAPKLTFPARVDKDHSNSVSGGLRWYRRAEADQVSSSRMELGEVTLNANPLMGLAYATEELLTDSPRSFAAMIANGFDDELENKLIKERIRGTGSGEFTGILNANCTIGISRDTSDQIKGTDVTSMRQRVWNYQNAVWVANNDTYEQLLDVHISGTNSDIFLYSPARGEDVPDTLLGRPLFFSEYASTLGSQGDLMCCVWSEYLQGLYQRMESQQSIHVRFVNHERAFKVTARNDGTPWWSSALTPVESSETLSPFVVLNA